ncbi:MAG: hypothetical protein AAB384_01810 [Patescibacteria group bacterium]|mgnify:CR=1 FL=1
MKFQASYHSVANAQPSRTRSAIFAVVRRAAAWAVESTGARILVLSLIAVIGVAYIGVMSSVSTKGYELKRVEREVTALRDTNERMQIHIAEQGSLRRVSERVRNLNMVPIDGVTFAVTLTQQPVAHR